ncbi:hypothetical protein SAMN05216275_16714 [Streptosporangium canum]|uniref:Uncharacterized protein n=1 Tax=Streptosporangium canum TaxID=324952 RepID=A0A1I4FMC0_9ACTN|nr:hypothetical protein SAMN05216275_16714 [Streptosporangium canum]
MLELGDRPEDLEEHPADRGGGVDALVEDDETDTASLEFLRQLDEVFQGAAEPVEFGDHELVALACDEEGLVELGPAGEFPAGLVGDDLLLMLKGGGYDEVRLLTADGMFAMPEV